MADALSRCLTVRVEVQENLKTMQTASPRRMPLSALVLFVLAALCALAAVVCFAGEGARLHPALADSMAGLAFLVSAVALAGSGAFPLVMARLAARDDSAD